MGLPTLLLLAMLGAGSKVQTGQAELARGNFDGALRAFDQALVDALDAPSVSRLHLWRAQAFAAKQDFGAAETALAAALEFDPEERLDPEKVDPALVKMLEALRGRLKGELRIVADHPGLKVKVDGAELGSAPTRTELPIGRHVVEGASQDGAFVAKQTVMVHPRSSAQAELVTVQAPAGSAPVAKLDHPIWPFAELRLDIDPTQAIPQNNPRQDSTFGFGLGGGIKWKWLRISASIRLLLQFSFQPRVGVVIPLNDKLDGYASLEIPITAVNAGPQVGLGAFAGIEYHFSQWLGVWAELGGRHFFTNPDQNTNGNDITDRFVIQAGLRLWLPGIG